MCRAGLLFSYLAPPVDVDRSTRISLLLPHTKNITSYTPRPSWIHRPGVHRAPDTRPGLRLIFAFPTPGFDTSTSSSSMISIYATNWANKYPLNVRLH